MIARTNPDGSQIIYLVPPNLQGVTSQDRPQVQEGPQTIRLLRAPMQGGPSQPVLEGPNIVNFQCSRAPADVCILGRSESKFYVLVAFDPVSGTQREIARLPQAGGGWNWGISPDGSAVAAMELSGTNQQIHLVSLTGNPHARSTLRAGTISFPSIGLRTGKAFLFPAILPGTSPHCYTWTWPGMRRHSGK